MAFINSSTQDALHKGSIIPSVITKGSKIKLKHYSVFEPITNVIKIIQENNIVMDLPEKLLENNVLIGDTIICIYYDKNIEYVITGEVANITLLYPQQITIKVDNVEKYDNQRKHIRYQVSLSANVTEPNFNETYFVVVKNVSIVGASFTCKEEIQRGTEVLLDIAVSPNKIISYYGNIVRVRKMPNFYEYGIVQTKIDDANYREMVKYIQQLEEEERQYFSNRD